LEILQDFGNQTEDDLKSDTQFMAGLRESLAAAVANASQALKSITANDIQIRDITLTPARRLAGVTWSGRRLAQSKLSVDYAIAVPQSMAAQAAAMSSELASNTAAFQNTFETKYKAAETARLGYEPVIATTISTTVGVETPAPTQPPATMGPAPTPAPTPAPPPPPPTPTPTPTPAPAPAPAPAPKEEEESDGTGTIIGAAVGAIAGVGLLGFLFYMYKKKQAAE
jgi:type II secretory pathway pseudopilin PulG